MPGKRRGVAGAKGTGDPRRRGRGAGRALALAGLMLAGPPPYRAAQAPAVPAVAETVDVVELSVLADVPSRRGTLGWDPVGSEDVELWEDGVRREVTEVEAAPQPRGSWRILVWIDGERCEPDRLQRRLEAIAAARQELAALGATELVAADPSPRVLARTVGWPGFAAEIVSRTRCRDAPREESDRLRAAGRPAEALAAWVRAEVARNDALLRFAGTATAAGPALLVLVSEGYDLRPHLRWAERERPAGADAFAERAVAATEDLGRGLAEGGWTVVVPVRAAAAPGGASAPAGPAGPASPAPSRTPMISVWPRRSHGQMRAAADYEVFLDFTLEPWRRVAALTAGGIASQPDDLSAALSAAGAKRRVWYRSARPRPGESRELSLELRRSDGQPIRAPRLLPARWAGAAVAAARVRAALASGMAGEGGLAWSASRVAQGWRVGLPAKARVRWAVVVPPGAGAPAPDPSFRVGDFGGEVMLPAGGVAPPAAALYLEDLESGAWLVAP